MTSNYFSHDSNARNDEKLIRLRMRHGAAGYGVYFMILERMRDANNYMCAKDYNLIAFDLRVDAALIKSVIEDFGLFVFANDGKYFYSESFLKRMEVKDEVSDTRRKAALKRWKSREQECTTDANAMQMQCTTDANAMQESKESKESKERNISSSKTRTREDEKISNDAFLKKFFSRSNQANIEVLLMNFGLKADDIAMMHKIAKEVVAEWEISKKEHANYTDWSQHLIATMRIKIKGKQQANDKTAIETEPPSAVEYQYDGGFGSKDV